MNSNGRNRNNTFEGDVFIDGNLTVTGTYPGGGGGGGDVTNPMTSNLNANNYEINNVSKITSGAYPQILVGELNLQGNTIRGVNQIEVNEIYSSSGDVKLNSSINGGNNSITNVNDLQINKLTTSGITVNCDSKALINLNAIQLVNGLTLSASFPYSENYVLYTMPTGVIDFREGVFNPMILDLICDNHAFIGVGELTAGEEGSIKMGSLDLQDNKIENVNTLTMSNGLIFNNDELVGTNGQALLVNNGVVYYSDVLTNPLTADLQVDGFNIVNVESVSANYVDTDNLNPKTGTHINVLANLDLNSNGITRIDRITCRTTASPSADLKLDLVPADIGLANQVLARDPNFDPAGSGNTKTVWLDAVLNPMTANLNVNGYSLTNVLGIGATNGGVANINLNGDIKSVVGNYISGITNLIGYSNTINIQGDVKITDSLDMSTKNINRCEVLDVNYIESKTNNIIRVSSLLTLENDMNADARAIYNASALTCYSGSVGSGSYLNLDLIPLTEGKANQYLARDPAFNPSNPATYKLVWQTPSGGSGVTNPMTANLDGGNYTITNLSSLTSTELKTTSIALSSGTIIQTSPLAVNTQLKVNAINPLTNPTILMPSVDFSGNIQLTNTAGYIQGNSIILRGRTSVGASTPLYIESSITYMSNKLFVLTDRSPSIGVRTTLFKTFGPMPNVNINSLTPVKLNSIITNQRGDNVIPAGAFTNGDKFVIIMTGLLTTIGSGSLNVYLYVGTTQAVSFNVINVASTGQPCKMTFELDCTTSGANVDLGSGTALFGMERTNTSIRYSTASATSTFSNNGLSNSIDIYVSQSATQTSSFLPLSYTIEQL
jgi:hypothetical protein